jgi:amino-acid N-acetyltransferase
MEDAKKIGLEKLFVLTINSDFFKKRGFTEIKKEELPWKIWADCVNCSRYPECSSVSLIKKI